jgi:hypothetical protein
LIDPRRYFPAVGIGGGAAGVILAIPILGDVLRCVFCVGVMAGAAGSMKFWLDSHQAEDLTPADAATLGACSGAASGVLAWFVSLPIRLVFGEGLNTFYEGLSFVPDVAKQNLRALYAPDTALVVASLPMQVVVYGLVGAVGGFVALQFLFKTRRSDG